MMSKGKGELTVGRTTGPPTLDSHHVVYNLHIDKVARLEGDTRFRLSFQRLMALCIQYHSKLSKIHRDRKVYSLL